MWAKESCFYQIYPLGFCGAPLFNDAVVTPRIQKVIPWIPHLTKLGVNAVYFSPLFDSDKHGYDTRDYQTLDVRLGTNEDMKQVCDALHQANINVVLDGVFNHVGRGFFAFQDVLQRRWDSPYKDWFHISFDGNSNYNDGLWYEGWEGHYEMVKLNLRNPAVVDYLLECVTFWVNEFGIDGLRLDVAYMLDHDFLRRLRSHCDWLKKDFYLLGEMIHGNYNTIVNDQMCHAATNYECYKGLYSAFNSMNMFEIAHSLNRQFGDQGDGLYRGKHLSTFVDNHDVNRIASTLENPHHLKLVYALAFAMPGIPCIYYGSEWGALGKRGYQCDEDLRPDFGAPQWNELCDAIAQFSRAKSGSDALCYGNYRNVVLTNHQLIFERKTQSQRVLVAINASDQPYTAHFDAGCGQATNLLDGTIHDFGGGTQLPPYSVSYWDMEH